MSMSPEPNEQEKPACLLEDGTFDHVWEMRNDSFDHEYGTEVVVCQECIYCGEQREYDYDGDDGRDFSGSYEP